MATSDSHAPEVTAKEVVIQRVFDAPRERVFDVLTTPEHLRKWWGPMTVSVPVAEIEARPDGRIRATVTLVDEGQRTRVTVRRSLSSVSAEWGEMARAGWGESLDKLAQALSTM